MIDFKMFLDVGEWAETSYTLYFAVKRGWNQLLSKLYNESCGQWLYQHSWTCEICMSPAETTRTENLRGNSWKKHWEGKMTGQ